MARVNIKRTKHKGGLLGLKKRMKTVSVVINTGIDRKAGNYPNSGPSVIDVAVRVSEGTSKIPPRNYFEKAYQDYYLNGVGGYNLTKRYAKAAIDVALGGSKADKVIREIGDLSVWLMRNLVIEWTLPPNALKTIRRKGFNDPLIHTKRMLGKIKWWKTVER